MATKYTTKTLSGYNATPPADDGTVSEANRLTWAKIKEKLTDPIKDQVAAIDTDLVTHVDEAVVDKAINYTITAAEHKKTVNATASITVNLGDAATMAAGFIVTIKNSHTAVITVGRATGADTIDGSASDDTLAPNQSRTYIVNTAEDGYLTKEQNKPVMHGRVPFATASGTVSGSESWTYVWISNSCTITHGLGTENYTVICTPYTGDFGSNEESIATIENIAATTFTIETFADTGSGLADSAKSFHFMVMID